MSASMKYPHWRGAGDCGTGLWYGNGSARRCNCRAGQCLCRSGQKAGIRTGRHRHDGRTLRDFVADADNDPAWIAADLMSQAEHDDVAQSVLICDNAEFADAVIAAVDALLNDSALILRAAVGKISALLLLLKM